MTLNCTVIVSSCDKYEDLWQPFFSLHHKNWPDNPFEILLITEEKYLDFASVTPLQLGGGKDWSTLLLEALEYVKTESVLLMLEDFFIARRVDSALIERSRYLFSLYGLGMLRLVPRPGPKSCSLVETDFGYLPKSAPYRVSTQAAIWSVKVLKSLLVPGESAQEFERNGTGRARELEGFGCMIRPVIPYGHHVVEKGKWFPWAAKKYSCMNIGVDLSRRDVMSTLEALGWILNKVISPIKPILQASGLSKFILSVCREQK